MSRKLYPFCFVYYENYGGEKSYEPVNPGCSDQKWASMWSVPSFSFRMFLETCFVVLISVNVKCFCTATLNTHQWTNTVGFQHFLLDGKVAVGFHCNTPVKKSLIGDEMSTTLSKLWWDSNKKKHASFVWQESEECFSLLLPGCYLQLSWN